LWGGGREGGREGGGRGVGSEEGERERRRDRERRGSHENEKPWVRIKILKLLSCIVHMPMTQSLLYEINTGNISPYLTPHHRNVVRAEVLIFSRYSKIPDVLCSYEMTHWGPGGGTRYIYTVEPRLTDTPEKRTPTI